MSQLRTHSFSFNTRHTKMAYFYLGHRCRNIDAQISINSKGQSTIVIEGNTFIDVKYSWDGQIMDEQIYVLKYHFAEDSIFLRNESKRA